MPELPSTTLPAECPDAEWVRLRAENAALRAQVVEQAAQIAELLLRVQELEARLAKDSHNSSKPPSSDPQGKRCILGGSWVTLLRGTTGPPEGSRGEYAQLS